MSGRSGRGQSEVLGVVLLVGVVVVLGVVLTVASFAFLDGTEATEPAVFETSVSSDTVTIVHRAGRSLTVADTSVVLRQAGDQRRHSLGSFSVVHGADDGAFAVGEALRRDHESEAGAVTLMIVDEEQNQVLYRDSFEVGAPDRPVVRFDEVSVESFETSQDADGSYRVTDDGRTLRLSNNTWKRIDYDYTVNESTVLAFDFRSDAEGEIHGIGLEDDNSQTSSRVFKLSGTQTWGEDAFDTYETGDGWVHYEVPVGEYYTGDAAYLLFVNDDDTDASGTSSFRDVTVYENESA